MPLTSQSDKVVTIFTTEKCHKYNLDVISTLITKEKSILVIHEAVFKGNPFQNILLELGKKEYTIIKVQVSYTEYNLNITITILT